MHPQMVYYRHEDDNCYRLRRCISGIEDAYKMVRLMYTKYVRSDGSPYNNRSFGKIEYIKKLRKFASEALDMYENDEDFELKEMASLRFTKQYADTVWREKDK